MRKKRERSGVVVKGNNNKVFLVGPESFRDAVIVIGITITVLAVLFRCPSSLGELIELIRMALGN